MGLFSAFAVVVFIVFVIGVIVAVATKPTEATLRNAVIEKYGMIYGAGVVAEKLGVLNFSYQDRLIYSTLSVNVVTQKEEIIALGYLGRVTVPDLKFGSDDGNKQSSTTISTPSSIPTTSTPPNIPISSPEPQEQIPNGNSLGAEEIRNGLRTVYPMMKNEMLTAAMNAARQKHPASTFVGKGCEQKSLTTDAYQEVRWNYNGNYQCQMKGAILGINNFVFDVQVQDQVNLKNGTFMRSIVRASAN